MEIIDSHTHWGPSAQMGITVTTDELLRQARQSGVDRIVIFPFPSQALADEGINGELLDDARRIPQFIPYYYIPDDLRTIPGEKGFFGGKWHWTRGISDCSSNYEVLDDPALPGMLDKHYITRLNEEIELLDIAGDAFDLDAIRAGDLTPMFFGSAITNFGIEPFLHRFLRYTLPPTPRMSDQGEIRPDSPDFSGFIFKIQANMNPAHRDRLAFLRVVSGTFRRDMNVWHSAQDKVIQLKAPQQFMADEREMVDTAYPGDILGLFDPGIYHLGDTLCEGSRHFQFGRIPVFAPEHFARVRPLDSMKRKQFLKGMDQLSEEGAIQVFIRDETGLEEMLAGVVGVLQFDVLTYRLKSEYGVDLVIDQLPWHYIRWLTDPDVDTSSLTLTSSSARARDSEGHQVLLFENEWSIRLALERNKGLELNELPPLSEEF